MPKTPRCNIKLCALKSRPTGFIFKDPGNGHIWTIGEEPDEKGLWVKKCVSYSDQTIEPEPYEWPAQYIKKANNGGFKSQRENTEIINTLQEKVAKLEFENDKLRTQLAEFIPPESESDSEDEEERRRRERKARKRAARAKHNK